MNSRYSALALSALALSAVVLTSTEAPATRSDPVPGACPATAQASEWPDEGSGYPGYGIRSMSPEYSYPKHDPKYEVPPVAAAVAPIPPDDLWIEAPQAGAFALGGAAAAFGVIWLYRRRMLAG
jgi:hypothetical protein